MKTNTTLALILLIAIGCGISFAQPPNSPRRTQKNEKRAEIIANAVALIESGEGFMIVEPDIPMENIAGHDQFVFEAIGKPDSTWCDVTKQGREITYYLFRSQEGEGHDSIIGIDSRSGFIGI
ncbi:MAG: hypothetical protein R3Y19_07045 [Rikenellaceae bacterium]